MACLCKEFVKGGFNFGLLFQDWGLKRKDPKPEALGAEGELLRLGAHFRLFSLSSVFQDLPFRLRA